MLCFMNVLIEQVQALEDRACHHAEWDNFQAAIEMGKEYAPGFDIIDISSTTHRSKWLIRLHKGEFPNPLFEYMDLVGVHKVEELEDIWDKDILDMLILHGGCDKEQIRDLVYSYFIPF